MAHNDSLVLIPLNDGKTWHLARDAVFNSKVLGSEILMKHGFEFNFSSVPRVFWIFYPPATGKYRRAAAFHYWMYSTQLHTREQADRVFLEIMQEDDVPVVATKLLFLSVCLFGWLAWEDMPIEEIIKHRRLLNNSDSVDVCDI